jgi:Gpi18-like mannosyltransferase
VPLGFFDLETAKNLWLTVSEVLFVASLYLAGRGVRSRRDLALSIVACAAFVPTLIAFFDQQTSMSSLFLLSPVLYGLQKDPQALSGAGLALSLIKPQGMVLVLIVTLPRLRRKDLVAFTVTIAAMLALGFALMPDWPIQWWNSASWLTRQVGRAVPTVWGLSWFLTSQYRLGEVLLGVLLATLLLNTDFTYAFTGGSCFPCT